jgi:hypothetical protein
MKLIIRTAAVAAGSLLALGLAGPAGAAPGDHGNGVGGCIDQLYGNATNPRTSGHGTLPSQSPGPWLNNATDPDNPTWGPSMGALIQQYGFNAGQLRGGCPF